MSGWAEDTVMVMNLLQITDEIFIEPDITGGLSQTQRLETVRCPATGTGKMGHGGTASTAGSRTVGHP